MSQPQRSQQTLSSRDRLAFTMRFTPEEALDIDEWILSLKRPARRSRVDRCEVIRILLVLARENPVLRDAVVQALACRRFPNSE